MTITMADAVESESIRRCLSFAVGDIDGIFPIQYSSTVHTFRRARRPPPAMNDSTITRYILYDRPPPPARRTLSSSKTPPFRRLLAAAATSFRRLPFVWPFDVLMMNNMHILHNRIIIDDRFFLLFLRDFEEAISVAAHRRCRRAPPPVQSRSIHRQSTTIITNNIEGNINDEKKN